MTYLEQLETKVLLERLVIGLEEPVLVKGLGELQAKIDSGNGGYNVIHGSDFHQQGDTLMFSTVDNFGHPKKISAKVIDSIEVNMGGGNIENRPVIELDIKFAGEDYKKIPFSVSDRSTNTHPILISKGFVEKELEALIDVGAKNISTDGIDVVYGESVLDEGFWSGVGKVAKGVGKVAGGVAKGVGKVAGGISNAYNGALKAVDKFGNLLGGKTTLGQMLGGIQDKFKNFSSSIGKANEVVKSDEEKIRQQFTNLTFAKKLLKDPDLSTESNYIKEIATNKYKTSDIPICLVTCYLATRGNPSDKKVISGLEKQREEWLKTIGKAKEGISNSREAKNQNNGDLNTKTPTQQNSSFEFESAMMLLEDGGVPATTGEATSPNENKSETEQPKPITVPEEQANQVPEEQANQQSQNPETADVDFEEVTTQFEQLCNFNLWFISIAKNKLQTESHIHSLDMIDKMLLSEFMDSPKVLDSQYGITDTQQSEKTDNKEQKQSEETDDKKQKQSEKTDEKEQKQSEETNTDNKKQKVESSKEQIKQITKFIQSGDLDKVLYQMFKVGEISKTSVEKQVKDLAQIFQKNGYQGLFCLSWQPQKQSELKDDLTSIKREYYFYEDPQYIAYAKKSNQEQTQTQEEEKTPEDKKEEINVEQELDKNFPHFSTILKNPEALKSEIIQHPEKYAYSYDTIKNHTNIQLPLTPETKIGNSVMKILLQDYIFNALNASDAGKIIIDKIKKTISPKTPASPRYMPDSAEETLQKISSIEGINEILSGKNPEESEEDAWINNKLQHLRTKGLV